MQYMVEVTEVVDGPVRKFYGPYRTPERANTIADKIETDYAQDGQPVMTSVRPLDTWLV